MTAFPREIENNGYAKFWGAKKMHNGRCARGIGLKKTKWRMELPEGFACPIPPSMGQFSKLVWTSIWNEHKVIAWSYWPCMTPNDYLNIVFH